MKWLWLLALSACDLQVPIGQQGTPPAHPQLDLLFVVGDSGAMAPVQDHLANGFPYFLYGLQVARGHLPDLRVGVTTTSMGAGAFTQAVPGCEHPSAGRLIAEAHQAIGPGCAPLAKPWIDIAENGAGKDVDDPARAFACLAHVGTGGCRFKQPLAAAVAALGANAPVENSGFLRPDAYLAVVFVTDEDDCSTPPDSLLFDPSQDSVDAPLGPLTAFRCADVGLLCDGQRIPRQPGGMVTDCQPDDYLPLIDPLHALTPTERLRQDLAALKRDPSRVLSVAFTQGQSQNDPVSLAIDPGPDIAPACRLPDGSAYQPQARLAATAGVHVPVCQGYGYELLGALGYMLGTWTFQPPRVD